MKFLYAEKWRGTITISTIRYFDSLDDVKNHVKTSARRTSYKFCWRIFSDNEPKLISRDEQKYVGIIREEYDE